jgi:hypothetical protein
MPGSAQAPDDIGEAQNDLALTRPPPTDHLLDGVAVGGGKRDGHDFVALNLQQDRRPLAARAGAGPKDCKEIFRRESVGRQEDQPWSPNIQREKRVGGREDVALLDIRQRANAFGEHAGGYQIARRARF